MKAALTPPSKPTSDFPRVSRCGEQMTGMEWCREQEWDSRANLQEVHILHVHALSYCSWLNYALQPGIASQAGRCDEEHLCHRHYSTRVRMSRLEVTDRGGPTCDHQAPTFLHDESLCIHLIRKKETMLLFSVDEHWGRGRAVPTQHHNLGIDLIFRSPYGLSTLDKNPYKDTFNAYNKLTISTTSPCPTQRRCCRMP